MGHLYVCEFSNGTIKIGRSAHPVARIATHVDRVSCVGVELLRSQIFDCGGSDAHSERELIRQCIAEASSVRGNEWFGGLDFHTVCRWAYRCAELRAPTGANQVIEVMGGRKEVMKITGLSKGRISQWVNENHIPPSWLVAFRALKPGSLPASVCGGVESVAVKEGA